MSYTVRAGLRTLSVPRHGLRCLSTSTSNLQHYPTTNDNPVPVNTNKPTPQPPQTSETNAPATSTVMGQDAALSEDPVEGEQMRLHQAPNRLQTWSRSQRPRSEAMAGPRFEQMNVQYQPRPYAAIDLIHKQPVRWTKEKQVSCNGGDLLVYLLWGAVCE
ncbi:MAG: hypothetical protein Q9162_000371 [Coniocarpon cinnabarinum]